MCARQHSTWKLTVTVSSLLASLHNYAGDSDRCRPDANYLNTPDLLEMETLFRQRPDTFLGFCKGGAKFSHRIADSGTPLLLPAAYFGTALYCMHLSVALHRFRTVDEASLE